MLTYNSEIISVGKKLRHKLIFDIPENIDYLRVFKNTFLKKERLNTKINKIINKKHK